jgi:hypothetical protein
LSKVKVKIQCTRRPKKREGSQYIYSIGSGRLVRFATWKQQRK